MYGYGFCTTCIIEWLHCKLQIRPLTREAAVHKKEIKHLSNIIKLKFGLGHQEVARHQDELAFTRQQLVKAEEFMYVTVQ
jgi:hypothetical protein